MTKKEGNKNMSQNNNEMRNADPIKWMGMIISVTPSLLLKSGSALLRFKRQAKKGGKVFKKELINQGFDKKTASVLTEQYLDGSRFIQTMIKVNR